MITDKIKIDSQGKGLEDALREVERFCEYRRFTPAQSLRMRLLAEETISMIRELSNDFTGEFWASGEGETCSLNVEGRALMTDDRREALMDVSSSGKNLLAKGVLGKIATFFDQGLSALCAGRWRNGLRPDVRGHGCCDEPDLRKLRHMVPAAVSQQCERRLRRGRGGDAGRGLGRAAKIHYRQRGG